MPSVFAFIHVTGLESDKICATSLTFENNAVYGNILNPYILNFVSAVEQTQTTNFASGWNWWSTYIEQEDIDGRGRMGQQPTHLPEPRGMWSGGQPWPSDGGDWRGAGGYYQCPWHG